MAAAVVALVAGLVTGATPVGAHATLIGTVPAVDATVDAVPEAVELQFDEPVETTDGAVEVYGPDGDRVDVGVVETADGGAALRAPIEADAPGTYTVAWRVTSEDGHTLSGSFVFHNGTATGAVEIGDSGGGTTTDLAGAAGRWLGYAGALLAVGAASLALLLPAGPAGPGRALGAREAGSVGGGDGQPPSDGHDTLPAAGEPGGGPSPAPAGTATLVEPSAPAPGRDLPDGGGTRGAVLARLRVLAVAGALAGAAGALVALAATLADSAGRSLADALTLVPDLAPDTRPGRLGLLRVACLLLAAGAAAVRPLWRRTPVPVLAGAAGAMVATAVAGHAWTAPDRWIAVAGDLAHLAAVGVWVGGLVALLLVLPQLAGPESRVRLATRFSALALVAVVVVAVSGTVSGWQQVGELDLLFSTTYGRLLVAKVVGFVGLVALGWTNRSRLLPALDRAVGPLQRSLRVETALAAVVLAVTAALVQQPPARTEADAGPVDLTATAESGEVATATIDPATAGPNDIHLFFYGPSGTEPLAVDAVQVTAGTADVPARVLQVTPITTNHVTVAGASLPSPGTWTVEVTAVQAGTPLTFTFEVPIS